MIDNTKTTHFRDVRTQLALYDMTISWNAKLLEYRINFKGGKPDSARYTDDLDNALRLGLRMRKERQLASERANPTPSVTTNLQLELSELYGVDYITTEAATNPDSDMTDKPPTSSKLPENGYDC